MSSNVPQTDLHWKPSWRVIPTRYPELNLWKRVVLPEDEAAVLEVENLTNNRVRQESAEINLLRPGDYFLAGCSQDVLAAFSYRGYGRFSTKRISVYYAANSLETAVYEKAHRTVTLLTDAKIPPTKVDMRAIKSDIQAKVCDIRGMQKTLPELYNPTSYAASQPWAAALWAKGVQGIVYTSVRHSQGECIAVYSPQVITSCHKDRILSFEWDGIDTIGINELKEYLRFKEE